MPWTGKRACRREHFIPSPDPDPKVVRLTFTFGFMTVVVSQLIYTLFLSVFWTMWMSRAPREQA
ncbi:hypothetical protein ABI_11870 [Asticcacaulis biprosthecium C19]|uniref:Uncharacterized protein n=1 Tax=Asticcacaulis biprosthecium C19 TaxID=715226 RepID=F4QHL3_9CAUL|nr:hypothetical protein [Asticcacaulis biprosthecium]EGF92750.1 hypothetical protein ABI_11870 [Asticcacaulis biprosthecium C19]